MRNFLVTCLFFPVMLFAQPMEWQPQGIPVEQNGRDIPIPFAGGMYDSKPEFVDIDADGDNDVFIGDQMGKLWFFENTGTALQPEWDFISDFYDSIDVGIWSSPAFCDIDADNDFDLLIGGGYIDSLFLYRNINNIYEPIWSLEDTAFTNGENCALFDLGDIDNDSDFDLIGSNYYDIRLFNNIGDSTNYIFMLSDTMISMSSYALGISLINLDSDYDLDIVCGDNNGSIWYLRNDGTPEQYSFTVVTPGLVPAPAPDTAPTLVDIDGDDDLDMFVGTGQAGIYTPFGGIRYYENTGSPEIYNFELRTDNYFTVDCGWKSTPRLVDIDNDGDEDLFIGYSSGGMAFYRNTGFPEEPCFELEEWWFQQLPGGNHCSPDFNDLDGDGDFDLLVGYGFDLNGGVNYFENTGSPEEPIFTLQYPQYLSFNFNHVNPMTCDIDNDGDYDLFIGGLYGNILFYRNEGNVSHPDFELVSENYENIDVGTDAKLCFHDIDRDGDYDLFIGFMAVYQGSPGIFFYENIGNTYAPNFVYVTDSWEDIIIHSYYSAPYFTDIDSDNDGDLFIGSDDGGITFWRNQEFSSVNRETGTGNPTFTLLPNYPNPFNAQTVIPFTLDRTFPVRIAVYNQLGQEVVTLIDERMNPGMYQMNWDASAVSSGVYLIQLETGEFTKSQKAILVK